MASADAQPAAVMLAGPTAAGKTGLAVELVQRFPLEIISVDSAMVYRGMDIGTAKPDPETLARAPHRLIDIRDPAEAYSAGEFCRDALAEMRAIWQQSRIPLLVGGTMLYFRALSRGMADLPGAEPALRAAIDREAERLGWAALHRRLRSIDPQAASRIEPQDAQRIQRAIEVYELTGKPLSQLQREFRARPARPSFTLTKLALIPSDRARLHQRIEQRFDAMLAGGFLAEVAGLRRRGGISETSNAMRAVGYRQLWQHLAGNLTLAEARSKAIAATRQLSKRQLTWLRAEKNLTVADPLENDALGQISIALSSILR